MQAQYNPSNDWKGCPWSLPQTSYENIPSKVLYQVTGCISIAFSRKILFFPRACRRTKNPLNYKDCEYFDIPCAGKGHNINTGTYNDCPKTIYVLTRALKVLIYAAFWRKISFSFRESINIFFVNLQRFRSLFCFF